ncbi:MAG: serine/threonine protein kinase [Actinomycetota bacterium]|nr:serine/threonine protein kinase [Actinomycetota bacterium]
MAPLFADRYEIVGRLGGGGYGTVHEAFDHNLGRTVALKVFRRGASEIFALHEGRILTALESDHILRVFDANAYQDIPYLVTEVAPLRSAEDHLGFRGVPAPTAIRWVRHLLVGLVVCHTNRLLHLDLKPANLFLQSEDHAQLGDFGVARQLDASGESPAHGSWQVRAPELYERGKANAVSDLYSAGVTAWRLLTGAYPYDGPTVDEIRDLVIAGRRPRLRDLAPHVPQPLALRVERAMALDPADRYESAQEMHDDLAHLDRLDIVWHEGTPHPGHLRCWQGASKTGRGSLIVCVFPTEAGRFQIETRHSGAHAARLRAYCSVVAARDLPRALRTVFNAL